MITAYSELPRIRENHSRSKIAFTGGCYDLLHVGHRAHLEFCSTQGDLLVVGVVSDARIKERKGPARPILGELTRVSMVDALDCVDYSFVMPPRSSQAHRSPTMRVIKDLRPNTFVEHVEAAHWTEEETDLLRSLGVDLVFDATPRITSTTEIIGKLMTANALRQCTVTG